MKLIADEYTTKEISERLNIGFRTAENYRYSMIKKLDVKKYRRTGKSGVAIRTDPSFLQNKNYGNVKQSDHFSGFAIWRLFRCR